MENIRIEKGGPTHIKLRIEASLFRIYVKRFDLKTNGLVKKWGRWLLQFCGF